MVDTRHLSWENLQDLIALGLPRRITIVGTPSVELMIEAGGSGIGLAIPRGSIVELPEPLLFEVDLESRSIDGTEYLYLATRSPRLFREFYTLIMDIADQIQVHAIPASDAITHQIQAWQQLLKRAAALTNEEEVGLWGELWLLVRLVKSLGPDALESWTGPLREPHDFRLPEFDLEVKTTRSLRRIHTISNLVQLVPAADRPLYLLSLQIQPAGSAGYRLPDMFDMVADLLSPSPVRLEEFLATLQAALGFSTEHARHYSTRYELRTDPILVPVNATCPKITPTELMKAVPSELLPRISHVRYSIDVEGLGILSGAEEIQSILVKSLI